MDRTEEWREMYLTAQHVRARTGRDGVQAYLHMHDIPGAPFPSDPMLVPQHSPGRVVRRHIGLPPGGNNILSYLDVVAPDATAVQAGTGLDGTSTQWWQHTLEPIVTLMYRSPLPWVVKAGDVLVIFNASPANSAHEYADLVNAALRLWDEWRILQNLP